jgi:hypothetical protein
MKLLFLVTALFFLTISHAQNVGIGISTPQARLHVADSAVLFTGPVTIPGTTIYNPPASGAGSRMLWYPQKAAFRVGAVDDTQWDKDSIGRFSFSSGQNTKANGEASTSMGYYTIASGNYSTSLGNATTASGIGSTSMGYISIASGNYSTCMGLNTLAAGDYSTTMGINTLASGDYSTSMGALTNAGGDYSTSMGNGTVANGDNSTSMGYTTFANGTNSTSMGSLTHASGANSTSMGDGSYAKAYASFSIGTYNDDSDSPNPNSAAPGDRIFQVGNGTFSSKTNALTVLRNGNLGIGISAPGFPLNFTNINGDKISLSGISGNHYGLGVQTGLLQMYTDAATSDIVFGFGSSNAFTEKMRIKGNGNVGIGTTNPTRPLSFAAALGEKILLYPGAAGEVGIGVYGNELRLHSDNPGAKVSFGTQTNAGVFTEAGKFEINGGYALSVFGNIWANGTTYASDERFKQNITAIKSPLQKLLQINGVEYEMKTKEFANNHFMPGRQIGLLAQNVEKIGPEAVNEKDGYKGVDYARLVPLLIESIKEQNKKIEEQQNQIDELKKLLEQLVKK